MAPTGATTRVERNANFDKLRAGYLFPEVRTRVGRGHVMFSFETEGRIGWGVM